MNSWQRLPCWEALLSTDTRQEAREGLNQLGLSSVPKDKMEKVLFVSFCIMFYVYVYIYILYLRQLQPSSAHDLNSAALPGMGLVRQRPSAS